MWIFRQSTASQEILLGKFVDDTDGKTAETALSIANTDIKVFKAGATSQASKNSGGATHIANGWYSAVLDATDTDTVGSGQITVDVAGALSVAARFIVLSAPQYDQLFGSTATVPANVLTWLGTTPLGLSSQQVQAVVPDSQKVDVNTIKTQTVTCSGGVTVPAATLASTTNITAGTMTTTTNLTNAPPDSAGVTTLLSRVPSGIFTGITSLAQWLGLIAGKQTGNSTARTELRATGAGSGTYDETTDSQEALRDRGDAAWVTATGFSTLNEAGVRSAVGLASANLDTQIGLLATAANLATLAAKFSGITLLAEWLGLIAGKQVGNSTARTELRATGAGSGTFDETTDSLEASKDAALTAAGVRSAVGLASANLDTQLEALPTATENAAAMLDTADGVETGVTHRQALRIILAGEAGKLSGAETDTVRIRNVGDSKDRIVATVDEDGNRTAVTVDGT